MNAQDAAEMGADMVMAQMAGKNGKNGNGVKRVALWGTAIVSVIVITIFISNIIGGSYRKDFRIEQFEKELALLCIQIKEIDLKIKQMELIDIQHRTETTQRLKNLEVTIEKIDNLLGNINTDMAVIKEINKNVKKLTGN